MKRRVYPLKDELTRHVMRADRAGVKRPQFKIGPYAFSLWIYLDVPTLFVSYHSPGGSIFLGRVVRARFKPDKAFRADRDLEPIKKFLANPKKAAAAAALSHTAARGVGEPDGPLCACCSRRLGINDVKFGMGTACRGNWGFE